MSTSHQPGRSRTKAEWNLPHLGMIMIPAAAVLVAAAAIATSLARHPAPVPVDRYFGRLVAPTADGGCAQFEFNNVNAELTPKGSAACTDVLASVRLPRSPAPAAAPVAPITAAAANAVTAAPADPVVTGNTSGSRVEKIGKHFRTQ